MTSFRPTRAWRALRRQIGFTVFTLLAASQACAASLGPFGAGLPDDGGLGALSHFPRIVGFLVSMQIYFNRHLTGAIKGMRADGAELWTLLGLSFLYGVVHAAGPGHGKAVVSSYVLATRQTLRNGVLLAFVASMAQAAGAIAIVLVLSVALRMTSVSITWATFQFEIVSDALIVLLGCWLVWIKVARPAARSVAVSAPARPELFGAPALSSAAASPFRTMAAGVAAPPARQFVCDEAETDEDCDCGGLHIPGAAMAAGKLDWRKAWTVVASTALRPCTGALIVLVYSISRKLLIAGVVATLVMGLGTALTVSVLAVLAVTARKTAFAVAGADSPVGRKLKRVIEIGGAFAVLLFGAVLLAGALLLR